MLLAPSAGLLTTTLLVALYYVLPMDTAIDTHTVLLLILYLAVFAAVLTWRIRDISRSEYPGLRAVNTLAAVVPLYLLAFATTYFLAERRRYLPRPHMQGTIRGPWSPCTP